CLRCGLEYLDRWTIGPIGPIGLIRQRSPDPVLRKRRSNDCQELLSDQARSPDQGPVYIGLTYQRGGVVRLYAAAVLNRKRIGQFLAEAPPDLLADKGVGLLRLFRGGVAP